ncbi:alcohol dehydrogenase catalytic domain-containing protein [Actinoplanes sp. LDG1-06]|uniref:Alcohol dehydrogenase catalytic domain-containing protein n=1 Tax=Paractinoplanes ovalisporus TaxID=2810368 RepID=A0ABS2A3H9_9ACTN|nr:alcohol dehydrogenase catalytic domain-containing protein [Actinoplanes ovalisporus]MBM2614398.1 alcohol dehydrogenase catalytic domain-containing protein [Actinoplanes ovalisporus]
MLVSRLHAAGVVRLHTEEQPSPAGTGDRLVEVTSVGICGSDLHWFTEGAIGDAAVARPLVLGHEMAGVIRGGPDDGSRVAIDPAVPCEHCEPCREGNVNLCLNIVFAGHGSCDGGMRQFMTWPAHRLHRLPDSISDDEGALLEPLGVALHALDLGHMRMATTVAVVGCGPIGLLLIQLALGHGATRVLAAEPLPHRMTAALESGAERAGDDADGVADLVFEVSGSEPAVDTALRLAKPGARVILVGIPDGDRTSFSAARARRKGLSLVLARRMGEVYPRAIDLTARGLVNLAPLATGAFPLKDVNAALTSAAAREGLKVLIHPNA